MKRRSFSINVSLFLTALFFLALCLLTYFIPPVVTSLINVTDNLGFRGSITETARTLVLIDAYAMVAVAFAAVILLFLLLLTVRRGEIFTAKATRLLGCISWCCFGEGLLFALLTVHFQLALGVAFGVCLVGLCLRVVKDALEEATRIKSENDLTV